MTHRLLLAPLRPSAYRERSAGAGPAIALGAVLALGAVPVTALLQRDAPHVVPAGVSSQLAARTPTPGRAVSAVAARLDGHETRAARASRSARTVTRPPARPTRTRTVHRVVFEQRGKASWYGPGFHGRRTASGERFDTGEMTAAHRTLPFGSRVQVCTRRRCVTVRINDRGPFVRGRVVDLSRAAAQALGIEGTGVARVTVRVRRAITVVAPAPRPSAPRPAAPAPTAIRPASAAPTASPVALVPAATTTLAGADGSVSAPGVAVVATMVFLLWAAPTLAARRRREGLDFTR